jgi:hypothetical protein
VAAALVLATVAWAFLGMRARLHLRRADGLPADPLVRATAVSYQVARQLPQLPHAGGIVLLQPVAGAAAAAQAERLGENWVIGSPLHAILDGVAGPRVILGGDVPIRWANGLLTAPASALVLVDAGYELRPWGPVPQALFYQVLTDVGRGLFERARRHLYRAGRLNGETVAFFYDPDVMLVSLDEVLARADEFVATLPDPGAHELFHNLVRACTEGES